MAAPVSKRIKTLSVTRPIVFGNTAKKFGDVRPPNAPTEHTHLWTIFVRGPQNEDISYYVEKVVFKLHDTYPNPIRTVEAPPFELTETGWGEFEINIKIYFVQESGEKNISFYHHLRLHPYIFTTDQKPIPEQMNEVSSSFYDEIIFNEPNEAFFKILMSKPGNLLPSNKTKDCVFSKQLEQEEIYRIQNGINTIKGQIEELKANITQKLKENESKN
ncbi:hypothetical protein TPHA_0F01760 [Tetrapisispora phaffii CBS 4417]|uniref:Protein AF-9 homolog n=1 Tax=Tetrapisispora phaffii (strain ATCC 24235 / CBS 4417 / NBRC 1672 / NRRL Y-8282 / UCD 70-5) TaxID=1071381 RepID=G8BV78_TETPH|nr:hypothetical protein TPHA_0F01760 [Tetrapisispora phaffii CBS 4417]CCE63660.1 hypothetical protein TPHA_0F01760 [Tetrapisispora phaffii CBS 4417]